MATSTPIESSFDVESFIKEYYDAWSGTDLDRIMSFYTEDVVLQTPSALMMGREAVRDQFVRPFITAFPGNRHFVKKMVLGPGVATVEFSFEAEHSGVFAGHPASGARIKLPGCGVYEYVSAKRQITSGRIYFDVGTLLQSITLVNEPKEAVEALQLNERNFRLFMNTIPTFAGSARPDGYCDFLNQRWLDYTGMTAEQATGWGWGEAIHPDDRKGIVEYWQSALAAGEPVEAEARLRRFDGAYRWCLIRASPLRDDSGRIVKWYGTTIDIEDRRRREEALRQSEFSWRQIVDNIPGLVCTWSPTGEVEFVNQQTLEYFGRTREELLDWTHIGAIHPDDLPRVIETRKMALEAGKAYDSVHRCRRADGVYRWFQVRAQPVRNAGGEITAWYLLLTDIDDRKKAEEALQASEQNLNLTLNTISTFIGVCGADGSILWVNQSALDYHGISLEDVRKEDFSTRWYHPDDLEGLREVLGESLKRPQRFECEYRALGKDGKYRWFLVRYNPLIDDQGGIERWYVVAFEIEDRKGIEEALRKSEHQFRLLVETIPALVWRSTPEGNLDYLNRRAVEFLGHASEDLAGGRWLELVHPDHRDATLQRWLQSATAGTAYEDEYLLRRADGQHRWIQSVGEPFLDTEGRITNWYGVVFDIDDRKRAEDALVRQAGVRADVSEAFSKPAHLGDILRGCAEAIVRHLDAAFARIWILDTDGSTLELQASAGMYTRLDGTFSRIPVGDLKVGWIARQKKSHLTNDVMNDPSVKDKGWARSNGMVAFAGHPLVVEDRLIGVVALFARHTLPESIVNTLASVADTIAQGIERKRAEESLRNALEEVQKSEAKLRQITNAIPILIQVLRPDGSVVYANQPVLDYTGLTLEEVQREDYRARVFHQEDVERLREERREALGRPVPFENEQRVLGKDGSYRWFLIRYNPLLDDEGRIDRWYVVGVDIEDRKLAEAQVEQAYLRLAEAQELSKTGSFITDLVADDHDWSEEAFRIFEFDPAAKVTVQLVRETIHPEDLPSFDAMIARSMAGTDVDFVFRIVTSRGALKHVRGMARVMTQIEGRPLFIGALQDITESKAAEEALSRARAELAHMARVTTLSALTASLSHEVNQPIAAAITSAGACLRWLNRDQPDIQKARDAAVRIEQDARRAAEIISHLKSFYRKDVSPLRGLVSVNKLIEEMLVLLRSEADRHSVVMRTELATAQLQVSGDRVQLQQVLMNLMLNAMESMTEHGGELKISSRCEGSEVIVSVSDTGVGIPAGKMEEIFNPFVTTKVDGTGMGLAISGTIIESHSGRLWATPNAERGTTFHFTLPAEREAQSEH